ncbi:hypothetical protein [Mycobacteroides abscessus]|uniref:hypothetical protein n=1 Tax=Mycobacteroides abscessus TaxID=36809 RepID=UPI000C266C06|nr:hypothetical protein [Mycobacteroides abscessus]
MANEGGSGEPMPHVRGLDGARLAQAAAAMTQAGGANLTAGARKWSSEALAGKVPDTATYESERPWMDEALHPVDRFELLWDAAGRCNVVVSVHEIATVRLARDRWETARSFSFGLDPFRAVQGRHEGGGSSSAEGSPSPGPDPGEGAAGVVLADELDLDEVALALAGGIPESGGKVGVVEGYKDALRPAEDEVFTGEPTGWRRLATLEQVASLPDGTVVIWNDDHDDRQAGVLETEDERGRVVRPISIGRYEDDWSLGAVLPPVWVVTFDDPPEVREA